MSLYPSHRFMQRTPTSLASFNIFDFGALTVLFNEVRNGHYRQTDRHQATNRMQLILETRFISSVWKFPTFQARGRAACHYKDWVIVMSVSFTLESQRQDSKHSRLWASWEKKPQENQIIQIVALWIIPSEIKLTLAWLSHRARGLAPVIRNLLPAYSHSWTLIW